MRNISTLTYLIKKYYPAEEPKQELILGQGLDKELIEMDCEEFSPSEKSVKNILGFAASYDVMESENAGLIEMNLN